MGFGYVGMHSIDCRLWAILCIVAEKPLYRNTRELGKNTVEPRVNPM